jgi:hypothetical protein
MNDNIINFLSSEEGSSDFLVGPFQEYRVIIEGKVIPKLTGHDEGDKIALVLDHRFSVSFPKEFAYQAAWLIAHAIAIGAGYRSFLATSKDGPFAPNGTRLGEIPRT